MPIQDNCIHKPFIMGNTHSNQDFEIIKKEFHDHGINNCQIETFRLEIRIEKY